MAAPAELLLEPGCGTGEMPGIVRVMVIYWRLISGLMVYIS